MRKVVNPYFLILFKAKKKKKLKSLYCLKKIQKKLKARKKVKDLEQRKRKIRTMTKRLLDEATDAGTLEAWFYLESNSGFLKDRVAL